MLRIRLNCYGVNSTEVDTLGMLGMLLVRQGTAEAGHPSASASVPVASASACKCKCKCKCKWEVPWYQSAFHSAHPWPPIYLHSTCRLHVF